MPFGVSDLIVDFLPVPRIWDWSISQLKRRCRLAPRVAILDSYIIIDEILGDPLALNVPEWLIRSTFMLTSSLFNNSLFFQTGATFFYFTEFYADQFNPLLSEFVTQNNTTIGNYPRVDVFFNAKIQSSRIFLKLENVSAPIKHLINIDAPYNYYSGPFVPYRDFSVRFGLIWNFFD